MCLVSILPLNFAKVESGDHEENNLAKFGYILDMKVFFINNKFLNPSMLL
jgi:hypothetical protein